MQGSRLGSDQVADRKPSAARGKREGQEGVDAGDAGVVRWRRARQGRRLGRCCSRAAPPKAQAQRDAEATKLTPEDRVRLEATRRARERQRRRCRRRASAEGETRTEAWTLLQPQAAMQRRNVCRGSDQADAGRPSAARGRREGREGVDFGEAGVVRRQRARRGRRLGRCCSRKRPRNAATATPQRVPQKRPSWRRKTKCGSRTMWQSATRFTLELRVSAENDDDGN